MDKHLHIVAFNVPFPANYGGVIDVFYKIKSFYDAGIKVHLHCYNNGREPAPELLEICESVNYYPVKNFFQAVYSKVPYMVAQRQSDDLLDRLIADEYPIIFEGLHTCAFLSHPVLKERIKAVRLHHVEWDYYRSLGKAERNFFRKFYFYQESKKLKNFESILDDAEVVMAITKKDHNELKKQHDNIAYVPAFHPNTVVTSQPGYGDYALYHGNLQVIENNQAALYLVSKVFAGTDFVFKIAGRNPLPSLRKLISKFKNIELIENPTTAELDELIANAHINLLPSFQPSGPKIKLLNSIYTGRFCVTNTRMIQNTGLDKLCFVENDHKKIRELVGNLFTREFKSEHVKQRAGYLDKHYSNQQNVLGIIKQLYPAHQGSVLEYIA